MSSRKSILSLPAALALATIVCCACGPKKGTTGEGSTAGMARGGEKDQWQYCPVGYGWGPDFNKKVIEIIKNANCNPKDRSEASLVAGQAYMFDAVPALMEAAASEPDVTLKLAAMTALGTFNTKRVIRPFMKLLDDREPKIRSAAAQGLANLASSGDLIALDVMKKLAAGGNEELRSIALISLGRAGKYMATDGLIALLKNPNSTVRADAIDALGRISNKKAVGPLIEMLKDDDIDVRSRTCYALAQIGESAATEPLLKLLDDKEPQVRSSAAYAIGIIGDESAIQPLFEAFKKADQNDRWGYASALGSFGPKVFDIAVELAASDNKYLRQYGVDILSRLSDARAMPHLIKALDDQSEDVRKTAARSLGAGGQGSLKAMLDRLAKEKSVDVRIEIIRTLGYTGDPKALAPLVAAAKDDTDRARAEAVRALGYFDDDKAVEALMTALKDDSEWVKESAASSLGYIKIKKAVDALIELLKDEDAYVRSNAASSLGRIGDPRAIEPLAKLLEDKNEYVRQAILSALGDIGGDAALKKIIGALGDDKEYVREAAVRAIGNIMGSNELEDITGAMIALAKGLKDENFYVRESAAFSLARIEIPYTKEVVSALRDEMNEADDYLVNEVFWALSVTKDKEIVTEMLAAYAKGNFSVETPIEEAIANVENDEVMKTLRELLKSDDKYIRASAAVTLSLTSAQDAEQLALPLVTSNDAFLKEVGAYALMSCGGKDSIQPLIKLLGDPDEDVVQAAAQALQELSRKTENKDMVDPLLALMESDNHRIAMTAASSLGAIGDERALDKMLEIFKTSAKRLTSMGCGYMCGYVASVGSAISLLGGEKAADEMLRLLGDPNPRVRREAAYALAGMKLAKGEDIIVQRIKDETDLSLRDTLITLAGKVKSKKAVPVIKGLMKDADNYTKSTILAALGKIGDKKEGKYVAGFMNDPIRNIKFSAIAALGKLKYTKAAPDMIKMLRDERYESYYYTIVEALMDMGERDSVVEPLADLAKETNDKGLLIYAAVALANLGYDAARPAVEKRLSKFGVGGMVFDVLAYLYGDTAKGNELFNKLRDIKIPRNASMYADAILRAFDLKGDEGKKYMEKLVKEAKSAYISSVAKSYLNQED